MSKETTEHLVIPDDHAFPEDNFRRYEWLSNYIYEHKPPVIVKLGDSWDMSSLCSYDKGTKSFMMRNIKEDLEAGHYAEEVMFSRVLKYNARAVINKQKQYRPTVIKLIGNHEYRLQKMLESEPRFEGMYSMDDFNTRTGLPELTVDYLDSLIVDGVCYGHLIASGVIGRPFASASAMIRKTGMSCTMGHIHTLDISSLTKPDGTRMRGLIAGSFHDPEHKSFAGRQVDRLWWNGIVHKRNLVNGDYDLEEISIDRLAKEYT